MTKIEWTDTTWNPVTGCTKVSAGCDHCYAERITERFHGRGAFATVSLHHDRLGTPFRWRKPRRVFVNSMSDLFHADVPDEFIARVWAVMATAYRHTFQVLTKRHARMHSLLSSPRFVDMFDREFCAIPDWASRWPDLDYAPAGHVSHLLDGPLSNVWLGVSVENQQWADIRIPALLDTPAAVRFLSCEPLLGPLDDLNLDGIGWVIVGGESGPGARPMDLNWVRDIGAQSTAAAVPLFVKQLGSVWARQNRADSKGGDWSHWPADLRVREYPA